MLIWLRRVAREVRGELLVLVSCYCACEVIGVEI